MRLRLLPAVLAGALLLAGKVFAAMAVVPFLGLADDAYHHHRLIDEVRVEPHGEAGTLA